MPIEIIYRNSHCEWIDVEAPTQEDLDFLHERYEINMLLLEDTIDPNHLPKYEQDNSVKFFLMRENTELERASLNTISDISTKLGIFLMKDIIITIHRMKNRSVYEFKKEVLLAENAAIRSEKIALNLALKVMKSFDDESDSLIETMDNIENEIFLKNTNSTSQIRRLYKLKRKAGLNTRILNISSDWVDKFKTLGIEDAAFEDLKDKYKDVATDFDHLNLQIANLIQMYLALTDQKANQVMKVLAIYSMYFFPVTFIAGIYGMNFQFMPELQHKYGYFITLGLMGFISLLTFIYVRKKRW
ncbi:CorA family divalent cation transporter [Chryseobacterium sp.]|uniref:magnesium transporter CorA family protein n=1 Tax=Chryseobacterium sp. TaxID=1871047 RepID=UPI0011CCD3C2|nr:CorA family divalent cation transporter [Chryseobacterium sp.]TXF74944.1 magnesium transporter CorA [Chryseobacterium sp.]